MSRIIHAAWIFACWLLLADSSAAQEWTRFRGPNGQGQSEATTIPAEWTEADYNWKIKLPGIGHSSPVIWGDKIFLTSASAESASRSVLCLNVKDGNILWHKEYPSKSHHLHVQNSYASSTPALDKDRVYVCWGSPDQSTLLALDHSGKEVWKRDDLGVYESQHGFGTSPVVIEDMVLVAFEPDKPKSFVLAVNGKDGKDRWRAPQENAKGNQNAAYSPPFLYQPSGGAPQVLVACWGNGLLSLNPQTGKANWDLRIFGARPIACPLIVDDLIFANIGEGGGKANMVYAIKPGDERGKQPQVAYNVDYRNAPYVPSLVSAGKLVFLWKDNGLVSCIDAATGKFVYESQRVGGSYSGSPIRVKDKLYCISTTGEVVVLSASDKFQVISRQNLGEDSRSTPAVADGVMYLRTESQLFSLGGKKG